MLSERDFRVRLKVGDIGDKTRGKNKGRTSLGTDLKRRGDNTVTV